MVRGNGTDDFGPADFAAAAQLHPAADRLEHHLAGVQHIALVPVIEGKGAESPLHNHLAQTHTAGLQGDVGNAVDRHAGGYLQPEAGIAGDWQKPLGDRAHVGRQLGLERIEKHIGAQLDRLHLAGLASQPRRLVIRGDHAARGRGLQGPMATAHAQISSRYGNRGLASPSASIARGKIALHESGP